MKAAAGLHHIELGTVCGLEGFKRTLPSVARSSAAIAISDASMADLAKVDWEHVDVH
uniref:Uncharacterized protein n=1 Tax=Oryza meridionalis TaxID=40149 RepID=A0A0E0CI29_9ORYZ